MGKESIMSFIKDIAIAWIAGRQSDLQTMTMSFVNMSDSSIILQVDDRLIEVVIPSSFHIEGCDTSSSDEVFLVTSVGYKADETFENMLMTVNEKLERVTIQPDALSEVLDYLLLALQKYEMKKGEKLQKGMKRDVQRMQLEAQSSLAEDKSVESDAFNSDDNEPLSGDEESDMAVGSDDDNSPDHYGYDLASCESVGNAAQMQYSTSGFLYAMADRARLECESAQEKANEEEPDSASFNIHNYLRWCHVIPDPKLLTVYLIIHVGGIVRDDSLASAVDISVDSPVKISLLFDKNLWAQRDKKPLKPIDEDCKVTQEVPACSKSLTEESDERLHNMNRHSYGTGVLLPKLVRAYFQFLINDTLILEDKLKSRELFDELHQFTSMENTFVGLLCFLCARMRALQDWCVVCWNSLPYSVCRLRTCDRELCLFTFEELGVGTPVLQEVQTSPEIIDFELSLAIVATSSNRDVFEPFPTFLLEKEQLRGRSGWFSKVERVDSSNTAHMAARISSVHVHNPVSTISNKNLSVLRSVLQSYPPVAVMKECQDEVSLRNTLNKFWDRKIESDRQVMRGKRPEEQEGSSSWAKLKWLPYSVLRYVLSTSRLKLHLLKADENLPLFDAYYQFAVLHDSPEKEAYFESRRIQQRGSFFAFHGSAADNWYSILRNGIRCLSNTSYMSAGASYGTGIYLSNQVAISLPFCTQKGPGWGHGVLKDSISVLAICEVINGSIRGEESVSNPAFSSMSQAYSRGIMVVPPEHEKDVAIRYIIVMKGGSHFSVPGSIHGTMLSENIDLLRHYQALRSAYGVWQEEQRKIRSVERFQYMSKLCQQPRDREEGREEMSCAASATKDVEKQRDHSSVKASCQNPSVATVNRKSASCTGASTSSMKAIAREYKNIVKQINEAKERRPQSTDEDLPILAGIEVILPDESNICRWHVNLSQFLFKKYPLYKDLVECARQWNVPDVSVKLECIFPEAFPFSPPFVRVVSPKFSFHTGHVTVGGSICMELLTESGWSPVYTFESLIVQVVHAMIEGGGRLDKRAFLTRSEYSELEAREAFNRVARDHGWNVS
eukprot:c36832_g1_i1 orf=343-3543(-)